MRRTSMAVRNCAAMVALLLAATSCEEDPVSPPDDPGQELGLLFSYFKAEDLGPGDGLHLATSEDGYSWQALNGDEVLFEPSVSEVFRDPHITYRAGDGFHMVWTAAPRSIGYAHSSDLVHWEDEKLIPVMVHEPDAINCWAPETFYDEAAGQFLVFWATTIPGRFPETDESGDDGFNHRMYYVTTVDFETFSDTVLFYDPGFNVIDSTIVRNGDDYVMFSKSESLRPLTKFIYSAVAPQAEGPYGALSSALTKSFTEGPSVLDIDGTWFLFFEKYVLLQYGLLISNDLETWNDVSNELILPDGIRHGTAFKAPAGIIATLPR